MAHISAPLVGHDSGHGIYHTLGPLKGPIGVRGPNPKIPQKIILALYGRWEPLVGHKILLQGVGTFSRPGEPVPGNLFFCRPSALISEPSALISYIAFMGIQADLYISGAHPKRRAPKNYANPRYKCVQISDMDLIGDNT